MIGWRVFLLIVLSMSVAACGALPKEVRDVEWNADPSAVIVMLYSPYTTAGLVGAFDDRYYVPEVQLWGDGRIVWVVEEGAGRRIMGGRLATAELEALLERIVEVGFFEWEDACYTPGGHSMPPMHLQVNLAGRSKEMSEHGGAPDAYYELEEWLRSGAGAEGHEYVPTRGFLTVDPLSVDLEAPRWPEDASVTPDQVGEGRYVAGRTLAFAWELLSRNPTAPAYATYQGQTYRLMVQISGLSYDEPPRR